MASSSILSSSPKNTIMGLITDPHEQTGTASSYDAALTVSVENYFLQLTHAAGKEQEPCAMHNFLIPACFSKPSMF